MEVKLRTLYAGPKGTYDAGSVVDFDAKTAKALIDGGFAEKHDDRKKVVVHNANEGGEGQSDEGGQG